MENNLINTYKKAYGSDIPDVWDKVKLGITQTRSTAVIEKTTDKPDNSYTNLAIGAKYSWMVLMAATIIIMVFIVPMSAFLVRHQSNYAMAASYAAEAVPASASLMTVQVVDDIASGSFAPEQTAIGSVIFTHKQLAAISGTVISSVIGGVCMGVVLISCIRIYRRERINKRKE